MSDLPEQYRIAKESIEDWINSDKKVLNIVGIPNDHSEFILKIVSKNLKYGNNIIYVCGKDKVNNKLGRQFKNLNIKFVSFKEYRKEYTLKSDLVIYDELSSYDKNYDIDIKNNINQIKNKKIILFTYEKVNIECVLLELIILKNMKPYKEPRVIQSKLNLYKNISEHIYEYYKWFCKLGLNVLIVVPREEMISEVYKCYKEQLQFEEKNIFMWDGKKSFKGIEGNNFIITSILNDNIKYIPNLNIVVLGAEIELTSYEMIFLSSWVYSSTNKLSEFILLIRESSASVEKTSEILRGFNKRIWEKEYLNY